jgi:hypothetical protein
LKPRAGRLILGGRDPVPNVQEDLCVARPVWTGVWRKSLAPLGLENWTDQPVTSRCTDYAIPALQFTLVLCVHTEVSKEFFVPYLENVDEKHCVLLPCELKWQITRKRR